MNPKPKTAAVLTVFGVAKMSLKGRIEISNWLLRQADFLKYNHKYNPKEPAKRWTAKYLY